MKCDSPPKQTWKRKVLICKISIGNFFIDQCSLSREIGISWFLWNILSQASSIKKSTVLGGSEVLFSRHGEGRREFNTRHLTQDVWSRDELTSCQLRCSDSMLSPRPRMPRAAGPAPQAERGKFHLLPPPPSYQPLQPFQFPARGVPQAWCQRPGKIREGKSAAFIPQCWYHMPW